MKLHLAIIAFLLPVLGFAQGSLQFNQVKLVTSLETVPAGKVWKVVSAIIEIPENSSAAFTSTTSTCSEGAFRRNAVIINGVPTKFGHGMHGNPYSNTTQMMGTTILPLWLPAGSTLSGGPCNVQVSVIEFNIIP